MARIPAVRASAGLLLAPTPVSAVVALASTTVRFRVSGSVIFTLTIAGIGKGVVYGTSTCLVEVPEIVYKP